jgi:capsular exopolysaccharide synthesis family protein
MTTSARDRRPGERTDEPGRTAHFGDRSENRLAVSPVGSPPEEVVFSDEGIAPLGRRVAILETLTNHRAPAGEEIRLLRARLRDVCRRREARSVAITSAAPGEGKSTLAVGLAAAMAQDKTQRILLIEADLRRPSLSKLLGLGPAKGLGDWLAGRVDYLPVRRVDPGGFFLLVAGQTPLEQPELLGSTRMASFLGAARALFDFVLLDAMPLLPVADAVLIQDLVDGFLCVVRARTTPRAALLAAVDKIRPDRILGTVLNDFHELLPSYADRAYRTYGLSRE